MNVLVESLVSVGGSVFVENLDTTRVTDAGSTRTVMIVAGVLVIAAFVLIAITVWFWRNTVPDPEALESLAYFEERIVDSTSEPDESQRRRVPRAADAPGDHGGLRLARRLKKRHDEDATGSIERPVLRRGRRTGES